MRVVACLVLAWYPMLDGTGLPTISGVWMANTDAVTKFSGEPPYLFRMQICGGCLVPPLTAKLPVCTPWRLVVSAENGWPSACLAWTYCGHHSFLSGLLTGSMVGMRFPLKGCCHSMVPVGQLLANMTHHPQWRFCPVLSTMLQTWDSVHCMRPSLHHMLHTLVKLPISLNKLRWQYSFCWILWLDDVVPMLKAF